jgi:hypothetical protein
MRVIFFHMVPLKFGCGRDDSHGIRLPISDMFPITSLAALSRKTAFVSTIALASPLYNSLQSGSPSLPPSQASA